MCDLLFPLDPCPPLGTNHTDKNWGEKATKKVQNPIHIRQPDLPGLETWNPRTELIVYTDSSFSLAPSPIGNV